MFESTECPGAFLSVLYSCLKLCAVHSGHSHIGYNDVESVFLHSLDFVFYHRSKLFTER